MLNSDSKRLYRTKFLFSRYKKRETLTWEELKKSADQTTDVVRAVVENLVEHYDRIGDEELKTVFRLCQNSSDGLSVTEKRERIRQLDFPTDTVELISQKVDQSTGSVGAAMQEPTLHVGGEKENPEAENDLHDCFEQLVQNYDADSELIEAVRELTEIEFFGVQSGRMSPILHYLAPKVFPVINGRSSESMELLINETVSVQLSDYLDERERYMKIQDKFNFNPHLRELDYFLHWVQEDENIWTKRMQEGVSVNIWQAQPGSVGNSAPEELWPMWVERDIISVGWIGEVEKPESELKQQAANFVSRMSAGDIVVAKRGINDLLGLGVVTARGHEYVGETERELTYSNEDKSHQNIRHVDWLFTRDITNAINTDEWDLAKQFDQKAIVKYNCYEELRWQLCNKHQDEALPALESIEERSFEYATGNIETEPHYFWINSGSEDWYHEDGEAFYTMNTNAGTRRRNQSVYERAQSGDEILIYRNVPVQTIVGRGHVVEGLHKEVPDDEDEPVEGVTVAWDESLDGVDWGRLQTMPELEDSPVLESDNSHVVTELSEQEYKTILELAQGREQKYYWATANQDLWDLDAVEPGEEIFYSAYNESGRKRRLFESYETARSGDRVLFYHSAPVQQIVGEGVVVEGLHEEEPEFRDEPVEGITLRFENTLAPISWETITEIEELQDSQVLRNNARGALFPLSEPQFEAIQSAGDIDMQIEALRDRLSPPTIAIEFPEGLYFESKPELKRQIEASLNSGQHIIFTGPPGTGKTKLAKHICKQVVDKHGDLIDGHRFTTATAEWTTFDTIGGYVPNRSAEGDELVFQPRIFLDCFRKDGVIRNEWLVIDEINRSDIDKAFGQLFSVLSGDSVQLPYERDSPIEIASLDSSDAENDARLESIITDSDTFPVTPSWRLLATMNTYDKTSLYELSYAFMRRFNFVHVGVPPLVEDGEVRVSLLDPESDENYAAGWVAEDETLREPLEASYKQLAVVWYKVNNHQTIGPSIVRDILGYLAAAGSATLEDPGPALTDAVIALVFPQLEGMAPQEQRALVNALTDKDVQTKEGPVDLTLEGERLERKAEDFFNLPPRGDE